MFIDDEDIGNGFLLCCFPDQGLQIGTLRTHHHGGSRACFNGPNEGLTLFAQEIFHQALFPVQVTPSYQAEDDGQQDAGQNQPQSGEGNLG